MSLLDICVNGMRIRAVPDGRAQLNSVDEPQPRYEAPAAQFSAGIILVIRGINSIISTVFVRI